MYEELNPCPCCGGRAKIEYKTGVPLAYIVCRECGMLTGHYMLREQVEELVQCWNNRQPDTNKFIPHLKCCPMCGSEHVSVDDIFGQYVVACKDYENCGIQTKKYDTKEEAIAAWNKRD